MSEPPPGESRPDFRSSRRGYDRSEVERFVTESLERVASLTRQREALDAQLATLGVRGAADLQAEIESVGADVRDLLRSAQDAADSLRSRAADDAARWRAEAETEAAAVTEAAQGDAEQLRAAAWGAGTELLEQARREAEAMRDGARHDTLLIRAEAEQDAHKLVASARRDIQEEARSTRLAGERALAEAKAEAEQIVESARLEAEAAQERARALENRRSELMQELEEARAAIAGLEADLETRREALRLDRDDDRPEAAAEGTAGAAGQWAPDDASVRIVQVRPPRPSEEVDADAMAAEVERLREASNVRGEDGDVADATSPQPGPLEELPATPAPVVEPPLPEPPAEPEPPATSEAEAGSSDPGPEAQLEPEPEAEAEPEVDAAPEPTAPLIEPSPVAIVGEPEPVPTPAAAPEPEPLPAPEEAPEREETREPEASPVAVVAEPVPAPAAAPEPGPAPEPVAADAPTPAIDDLFSRLRGTPSGPSGNGEAPEEAEPPVAEPAAGADAPASAVSPPGRRLPAAADPFELRERLLVPLTNQALRSVKRIVLDLQNEALDELRTSDSWSPGSGAYEELFADDLADLQAAARRAGAEAAGQLAGGAAAPDIPETSPGSPGLGAALSGAVAGALTAAAGDRSTAAAVSRVFRGWRSDEAERRVRSAAYRAYHGGVLAGLAALGAGPVTGVPSGIPCAECPASRGGSWDPAGQLPDGAAVPPAHPDCVCTIAPA